MVEQIIPAATLIASFALTYLLFSTLAYGGARVIEWFGSQRRGVDLAWKWASVAGVGLAALCTYSNPDPQPPVSVANDVGGASSGFGSVLEPAYASGAGEEAGELAHRVASSHTASAEPDRRQTRPSVADRPPVAPPEPARAVEPTVAAVPNPVAQHENAAPKKAPERKRNESAQRVLAPNNPPQHVTATDGLPAAEPTAADAAPTDWGKSPWMGWTMVGVGLLAMGWALVGVCWMLWTEYRLRRRLAQLPAIELPEKVARRLQLNARARRVKFLRSKAEGPYACGLLRRRIVIPERCLAESTDDELTSLLAHELAHHLRGDLWWLCWGRLLKTVLPFQPLHWVAVQRWRAAEEVACDDWAVSCGASRLALARLLTRIAEWQVESARGAVAAVGQTHELVRRVHRLLDEEPRTERRGWPIVLGVTLLIAGLAPLAHLVTISVEMPTLPVMSSAALASDKEPEQQAGRPDSAPESTPAALPAEPSVQTDKLLTLNLIEEELDQLDAQLAELLSDPAARRAAPELIKTIQARRKRLRDLWRAAAAEEPDHS